MRRLFEYRYGMHTDTHFACLHLAPQASVCLSHFTTDSSEIEHERPRKFENQLSREDVEAQAALITHLYRSGVKTTEIHKALQKPGCRLGSAGRDAVSGRG